ncbi:MAG: tetratricopeptide repeat protein [bacterium]
MKDFIKIITWFGILFFLVAPGNLPKAAAKTIPKGSENVHDALRKQELLKAVRRNPRAWKERYLLGGIYLRENDFPAARRQLLEVIRIKPDFVKSYSGLAMCAMRLKELDKALEYWKLVRKYDQKNRIAQDFIYRIERKLKIDREISKISEKIKKRKADWKDKRELGEKYLSLKRYKEAVGMFEQALKSNPKDSKLSYQTAKTYLSLGQYDKASKYFSQAARLAPGNGQYALMAKRIKKVIANMKKREKP